MYLLQLPLWRLSGHVSMPSARLPLCLAWLPHLPHQLFSAAGHVNFPTKVQEIRLYSWRFLPSNYNYDRLEYQVRVYQHSISEEGASLIKGFFTYTKQNLFKFVSNFRNTI